MASSGSRARAVALAAGLAAFGVIAKPRVADRPRPLLFAALATCLVPLTRARLGLRPPALGRGLRMGAVAAAVISAAVASTAAIPAVRKGMVDRDVPRPTWHWLLVRIPLGSAWAEEMAFRGALATVAYDAFGPRAGQLFQAAVFGTWHIADAREAGEPVVSTVALTTVAGWVFADLARRSGSLAAPLITHLAANEAGAVAALWVRRRAGR